MTTITSEKTTETAKPPVAKLKDGLIYLNIWERQNDKGRFYNVSSPDDLPQIFIKETAVILKSAIYEEPFKPQVRSVSEVVRGIGATEYSDRCAPPKSSAR